MPSIRCNNKHGGNTHETASNTSSLFDFTDSSNSNTKSGNNGISNGVDSDFSASNTSAISMNTTMIKTIDLNYTNRKKEKRNKRNNS
eukprot:2764046-Ditylum_brightwellii.AAC.1